jgi:hypothetical protein
MLRLSVTEPLRLAVTYTQVADPPMPLMAFNMAAMKIRGGVKRANMVQSPIAVCGN